MRLAEPLEAWERQRREFVREHVVSTYVGCLLVLFAAVVAFFGITVETYFGTYWVLYVILSVTVLGLVVGEVGRRFAAVPADPQAGALEFWMLVGCLALVGGLIYLTGGHASGYKVLVAVPVLVSAVTYGKGPAFLVTFLSTGALLALDLLRAAPGGLPRLLGTDVALAGVLVLAGWLVGGLAEMERGVRRRMEEMAALDPLTGLFNHSKFFDLLWRAEEEAARRGVPLALVLLDLDDFRRYNEVFGYREGDVVLRRVGELVRRHTPEDGFAARFGGEEFALALPGADAGRAAALAEELRASV
ncbi:MAG: GGDEF domain-containing protein, partial [Firmicutes bacterium]|nr:GGDEF domain-containing protein [Bacillota bacterium]